MIQLALAFLGRMVRLPLTIVLCAAVVLPGCANMGGEGDDPNDVCRSDRVALRSTGDFFAQDIIAGAAIGAGVGALAGFAATGNARGALIGGLAGGALGAAGGYWRARQKQYQDQAQLYQAVSSDIDRENISIDKTQFAFSRLVACRNSEAARIRADFRAGRISRDLAAAAMAGVRARSESDIRLAQSINKNIQQRGADFSYASREVETGSGGGGAPASTTVSRTGRRVPVARRPSTVTQVQNASTTNVAKRDEFQRSIAQAQSSSNFELTPS